MFCLIGDFMQNRKHRRKQLTKNGGGDGVDFYLALYEKKSLKNGIFQRLEDEITADGIALTFWGAFAFMLIGGIGFGALNGAKDATEYASYVFPCCAAIVAGMTVYYENRKGILFVLSLILLYAGVITFMTIHGHKAQIVAGSTIVAMVLMFSALTSIASRSIVNSFKKERGRALVGAIAKQLSAIVGGTFLIYYAASFTHLNYGCFKEHGTAGDCVAIWKWWHSTKEIFWPLF